MIPKTTHQVLLRVTTDDIPPAEVDARCTTLEDEGFEVVRRRPKSIRQSDFNDAHVRCGHITAERLVVDGERARAARHELAPPKKTPRFVHPLQEILGSTKYPAPAPVLEACSGCDGPLGRYQDDEAGTIRVAGFCPECSVDIVADQALADREERS